MRPQYVFACSLDEALDIAVHSGHLRKKHGIRKWKDLTEHSHEEFPGTEEALAHNQRGVGTYTIGQGWEITAVK